MDFYISCFSNLVNDHNCKVEDYSVYIEKKQGFALLNPLSGYSQLVIYITDKGNYCLTVDGAGKFSHLEHGGFQLSSDGKFAGYRGKNYKISRKYKNGRYLTLREFAEAASF